MIFDHISNIKNYKNLSDSLRQALEFIDKTDFSKYEKGKHRVDGEKMFFLVNEYETRSQQSDILESHRKYIDLQYMISGNEIINFEVFANQIINKDYDEAADYSLFVGKNGNKLCISQGMFAIFFPQDLHMPGFAYNNPEIVRKIVVKILA